MYRSERVAKWCPGCGDYAILRALNNAFIDLNIPNKDIVIISGIGCSSRLPFYMNTYGIHSIHGRATTIATGLSLTRDNLKIIVITGDGDGLSIGLSHLIHTIRRDLDMTIILFNNRIYGLTKGQSSPTTSVDTITSTTPYGSKETPLNAIKIALISNGTFIARTHDSSLPLMKDVFVEAINHKGTSFVEVYQNCVIYNDKTFENLKNDSSFILHDGEEIRSVDNKLTLSKSNNEYLISDNNPLLHEEDNYFHAMLLSEIDNIYGIIYRKHES